MVYPAVYLAYLTSGFAFLISLRETLSGPKDHSVLLWDVESSRKISVLCPHWKKQDSEGSSRSDGHVLSVVYSDDGRFAAVGSRDAVVRIFDVLVNSKVAANGNNGLPPSNMVKEFRDHKGIILRYAFSPKRRSSFRRMKIGASKATILMK
jgi:WD40 repeat protein